MAGIIPVVINMNIDTAGTAEQVTADTSILPASVYFEALATNTGTIYVGVSDVSATDYIVALAAGEGFQLASDAPEWGRVSSSGLQLSAFYVDASVNGDDCNVTYMYRQGL